MADISVIVDYKDLENAKTALKRFQGAMDNLSVSKAVTATGKLESHVKNLTDAYLRGRIKQEQYNKGLEQAAVAYQKWGAKKEKALAVVKRFSDEAIKGHAITKQTIRLQEQEEQKVTRILAAYKPLEFAKVKYKQLQEEVNLLLKAEKISRSEAAQMLLKHRAAFQEFNSGAAKANNVFNQALQRTNRSISHMSVITQQAGYQIGDFLVQVQSGTNPMVAFGQQATQIAGTLTLLNGTVRGLGISWVAFGSILGVAIPLATAVGAVFMRTRQEAKESQPEIEKVTDKIKKLREAYQQFLDTRAAGEMGISEEQLFGRKTITQAQKELKEAQKALEKTIKAAEAASFMGGLGGGAMFTGLITGLGSSLDDYEGAVKRLKEAEEALARISFRDKYQEAIDLLDAYNKRTEERLSREEDFRVEAESYVRAKEQEIALAEVSAKYGENSLETLKLQQQQERENLQAKLEQQIAQEGLSLGMQDYVEKQLKALDDSHTLEQNLWKSENAAQNLSSALREASSAMAALSGFSSGLDKQISQASARVQALKNNANAANASRVAGLRFDLETKIQAAVDSGVDRSIVEAEFKGDRQKISELESLLSTEASIKGSRRRGRGRSLTTEDYLRTITEELSRKKELIGLYGEEKAIQERVVALQKQIQSKEIEISDEKLRSIVLQERAIEETLRKQEELYDTFTSGVEDALMELVDGSKTVGDAFRGLIRTMILEIYKQQVAEPFAQSAGTFISGLFGGSVDLNANGGVFSGGAKVKAFAKGGVVSGPTIFPMEGPQVGLMGEAGPEAIMPLERGPNGKLGVKNLGGNSRPISVTFNITTQDVKSFQRSQPQIASQIQRVLQQGNRNQ